MDITYSIEGETSSGEKLNSDTLMITNINKDFIELQSFGFVIIGYNIEDAADKIEYSLSNLFGLNCDLTHNGFEISIRSEKDCIKENISKVWEIPQVSAKIILAKKKTLIDEYNELVHKLRFIIALGKGIIPKHSTYTLYSEDKVCTKFQMAFSHINSIDPILLNVNLPNLLENGINEMTSWDKTKLQDFRTMIEFINASNSIYYDDNLLKIFQCFELLGGKSGQTDHLIPE